MEYVYPAVFQHNSDNSYTVVFPDLPGCVTEGKTLGGAIIYAQKALSQWIEYLTDIGENLPSASDPRDLQPENDAIVNLVSAVLFDNKAVKRTISIPKYLDDLVTENGLSLSRVLQDSLKARFS